MSEGGLAGVVAADSALGSIDGAVGELRYCGYLITELAASSTFAEVCYLLWHGELPAHAALVDLNARMAAARELSIDDLAIIENVATRQEPMDSLRSAVSALAPADIGAAVADRDKNMEHAIRLTACFPTVVAAYQRLRNGADPLPPKPELGHAANFLYMMSGEEPADEVARMLDQCLILHAEHGFNASTFSARVTAATLSDIYAAVTSAIGTLKGPLHGGANTAVMNTLLEIGNQKGIAPWLKATLARGERVMGFGHRVYKVVDPRALILKDFARRLGDLNGEPKWFQMSEKLEQLVKKRKGIDVNVDFYSASTYYAMGIPPDLYTCVFAISRIAGWTAHVMEQYAHNRLIRPRENWVGSGPREYVPIDQRG